jgi:hypothetical protein
MNFSEAESLMMAGRKMRLPEWTGYWFYFNGQIFVYTRTGDVLDTPDFETYMHRTDWEEVKTTGLGFDFALHAMKAGKKVARDGWNGKGQFVVMMEPFVLPPFNTQDTNRKVNDRTAKFIGEDQPLDCQAYCALYTAQGKWQPGWVPSQGDLFATDWVIVA